MKKTFQVAAVTLSLVSQVHAQDAVQWRVEDGGNGHWYQWVRQTDGISWTAAQDQSVSRGGHLATPTSVSENQFVFDLTLPTSAWQTRFGPWLGGFQNINAPDYLEPAGGWRWVTGEKWVWTAWWLGEPSNSYCYGDPEDTLHFIDYQPMWNDGDNICPECNPGPYLIEWSSDCNNDGIVDKGQILQGRLVDSDHNGVPDVCEIDPCPGDITNGGTVDAIDLSILLSAWGTSGQGEFDADADNNGIVDGGDLALVLGGWGPCPQ